MAVNEVKSLYKKEQGRIKRNKVSRNKIPGQWTKEKNGGSEPPEKEERSEDSELTIRARDEEKTDPNGIRGKGRRKEKLV